MSQEQESHEDLNKLISYPLPPSAPLHLQKPTSEFDRFPEAHYHLRLAVLQDDEGHSDYPIHMFTFRTLATLSTAARKIEDMFGGPFSQYSLKKDGIGALDIEGGGLEDGRTESIVIQYDSQTADESWSQFIGRLHNAEVGWTPCSP